MTWIRTVEQEKARGKLKDIYEEMIEKRGKISNILKSHSLNPEALKAHMDLYLSIMFDGDGLKREECEMIGVVVSAENSCEYCVKHHGEALYHYWKDREKIKKLQSNTAETNPDKRQRALIKYSKKLTANPENVTEEDVQSLRNAGLSDREILSVNLIVAYFNFVNRIALGLGVNFSEEEIRGYSY